MAEDRPANEEERLAREVAAQHPLAAKLLALAEHLIFARPAVTLLVVTLLTAVLLAQARNIGIDAGFSKQLPKDHPYVTKLLEHQEAFGGADLILVSLAQDHGTIYNERFLQALKDITSDVFFLPGVDRSRVQSLFTPGVRYLEVTEDGFHGDDVVPRNYKPSPEVFARIEQNVGKAKLRGRLVSLDERAALVVADLLEFHPVTGEKLDYREVAKGLEAIRAKYERDGMTVHIVGFAKVVGDVTDASNEVLGYFALALVLTTALLWLYCTNLKLALMPLTSALFAVAWEFGLLNMLGFGLDPFAILVPFLVLSIGVSHGIQMVNAWADALAEGVTDSKIAAIICFRRLAIPGTVALITDVVGFLTIYLINIEVIREMAINAALGMAAIIFTNKVMLPCLLSFMRISDPGAFVQRLHSRNVAGNALWNVLSRAATPKVGAALIGIGIVVTAWSTWVYPEMEIGDLQVGVPELRPDSRYNQDAAEIAADFAIGVDLLKVFAEAHPQACIEYDTMRTIDDLAWRLRNTDGVQGVASLPQMARLVASGTQEANPKWLVLPRNKYVLATATNAVPSGAGLANPDCSIMPLLVFAADHKAETIDRIVDVVESFEAEHGVDGLHFTIGSGNLGVMAATNDVIRATEKSVVLWVYVIVIAFVWASTGSFAAMCCTVLPLMVTSMATYAFMAKVGIGLKVATLPVVALGVGIGVDDSLYMLSVLQPALARGMTSSQAYHFTLQRTGKAVVFTSVALALSVATWLLSGLQFQADMGLLLVFMFTANLLGAVLLFPALVTLLLTPRAQRG